MLTTYARLRLGGDDLRARGVNLSIPSRLEVLALYKGSNWRLIERTVSQV